MNPFFTRSRGGGWHRVGRESSFPDLSLHPDAYRIAPRCRAFSIPKNAPPQGSEPLVEADLDLPGDLKDQVMVFKYQGKIHAIDHQCPHSSFPLSQGSLFDIEDFGVKLSAGVTCPKHGWSFDLFSGQGDRGNYKLKIWEVQLRDPTPSPEAPKEAGQEVDQEVWVRRKQRIG